MLQRGAGAGREHHHLVSAFSMVGNPELPGENCRGLQKNMELTHPAHLFADSLLPLTSKHNGKIETFLRRESAHSDEENSALFPRKWHIIKHITPPQQLSVQ